MKSAKRVIAAVVCEQTMEPQKVNIIHRENAPGVHFVRFNACLQDFDVYNRNNRRYFLEPMKKSWAAPHIKELVKKGDMFGENGHPDGTDPKRIVTIDPKMCCHRIVDYWFKGKSIYGTIETLNDDLYGKQFMMHLLQGCEAAFSLRALVPLTKVDAVHVDVKGAGHIITEDRVILPSHMAAYQDTSKPMDMVVGESMLPTKNVTMPITESMSSFQNMLNDLTMESMNLRDVIDQYEVEYESINLDKEQKNVILTEGRDSRGVKKTYIVSLEDYVKQQVSDMFRSMG